MTAARSDLMQTSGGEFVPADRRTVIARAVLSVLQNPTGIETLDWQIADAVLAASQPDREAVRAYYIMLHHDKNSGAHIVSLGFTCAEDAKAYNDALLLSGAGTKSDGGDQAAVVLDGIREALESRGYFHMANGRDIGLLLDTRSDTPIADSSEAGRGVEAALNVIETCLDPSGGDLYIDHIGSRSALKLAKAFAASLSAPVGEPVAWQYRYKPPNSAWSEWQSISQDTFEMLAPDAHLQTRMLYTHPPAPAVGADVREALGESSQTLEYLRREARTWGKIFSVNVDHVLDKNRKALSALTRPLGGFVQGSIADGGQCNEQSAPKLSPALRAYQALFEPPESDAYDNLTGALHDIKRHIEAGKPTDDVCVRTIERVLDQINAAYTALRSEMRQKSVAETHADAQRDDGLLSGVSADPINPGGPS